MREPYVVRYIELPCTLPGVTVRSADGCCNVYINSRLSQEQQKRALEHEMTHVLREDFDNGRPLEEVEPYRARKATETPTGNSPPGSVVTVGDMLKAFVSMEAERSESKRPPSRRLPPDIVKNDRRRR